MPTGVISTGLQDYHATIPDLSPPRSQGSSTGGASSIGDYVPRMYTPPTPPTPHDDDKVFRNSEWREYARIRERGPLERFQRGKIEARASVPDRWTLSNAITRSLTTSTVRGIAFRRTVAKLWKTLGKAVLYILRTVSWYRSFRTRRKIGGTSRECEIGQRGGGKSRKELGLKNKNCKFWIARSELEDPRVLIRPGS
ncbi:hypothetical protein WN48_04332 [Eufriesea mexicana]|nr:hypothetical protein WN48_04332 [Eufriesea mexicana]